MERMGNNKLFTAAIFLTFTTRSLLAFIFDAFQTYHYLETESTWFFFKLDITWKNEIPHDITFYGLSSKKYFHVFEVVK
jgi:hypothetical protein